MVCRASLQAVKTGLADFSRSSIVDLNHAAFASAYVMPYFAALGISYSASALLWRMDSTIEYRRAGPVFFWGPFPLPLELIEPKISYNRNPSRTIEIHLGQTKAARSDPQS